MARKIHAHGTISFVAGAIGNFVSGPFEGPFQEAVYTMMEELEEEIEVDPAVLEQVFDLLRQRMEQLDETVGTVFEPIAAQLMQELPGW